MRDEWAAVVGGRDAENSGTEGESMKGQSSVYAQQTTEGEWIWWITAANDASIARSCRRYSTERGAIRAALAVAKLGDIAVDERNLR